MSNDPEQAEVKVGREVKFLEMHFADGESITATGAEATERFWEIVDQSASEYAKRGPCSICQNDEQSVMELATIAKIDGSKPYTLKDVVKALSPAKCPTCSSDDRAFRKCTVSQIAGHLGDCVDCTDQWHEEVMPDEARRLGRTKTLCEVNRGARRAVAVNECARLRKGETR